MSLERDKRKAMPFDQQSRRLAFFRLAAGLASGVPFRIRLSHWSPVVWSRIARGYLSGPVARAWKKWSRCPLLVLPNAIGRKQPKRLANEMVGLSVRESLLSQGPPVLRFFGSFRRDFPTSLVSPVHWVSVRVNSVPLIPSKIHGF